MWFPWGRKSETRESYYFVWSSECKLTVTALCFSTLYQSTSTYTTEKLKVSRPFKDHLIPFISYLPSKIAKVAALEKFNEMGYVRILEKSLAPSK